MAIDLNHTHRSFISHFPCVFVIFQPGLDVKTCIWDTHTRHASATPSQMLLWFAPLSLSVSASSILVFSILLLFSLCISHSSIPSDLMPLSLAYITWKIIHLLPLLNMPRPASYPLLSFTAVSICLVPSLIHLTLNSLSTQFSLCVYVLMPASHIQIHILCLKSQLNYALREGDTLVMICKNVESADAATTIPYPSTSSGSTSEKFPSLLPFQCVILIYGVCVW